MCSQAAAQKPSLSAAADQTRCVNLAPPAQRPLVLQRAKTDAFEGLEWDNPDRPEARNLLTIYQCVTGGLGWVQAWEGSRLSMSSASGGRTAMHWLASVGAPVLVHQALWQSWHELDCMALSRAQSSPGHPSCTTPAGMDKEAVLAEVGGMRWGDFKPRLADALVAHLEPIQARYNEVMQDEGALDAILAKVRTGVALRSGDQ